MTFPVFPSRPTAILLISYFRLFLRRLTLAGHIECFRKTTLTAHHIATELQADMHRQVHVHSGMPCKFNHYMHVCLAHNLKHCHIVAMGMTLLQLPNSL